MASVAAVLPDGRTFAGVVGTGRGFAFKVWSVTYPPEGAVRLVFRDSSGHELASLTRPAVPTLLVPPRAARPGSGAVIVGVAGGSIRAYLVDGHVGFWILPSGWYAYAPPLGTAVISVIAPTGARRWPGSSSRTARPARARPRTRSVRYQSSSGTPTPTSREGCPPRARHPRIYPAHGVHRRTDWPGTTVRLWYVAASADAYGDTSLDTATAYNAAGQVVAVVHLGAEASA